MLVMSLERLCQFALTVCLVCSCSLSDAQCVRECLWDCDISVHFSPFALHLCTWLRVTVGECMTSHEAPLNLRCGVTAVVPCGAPLAAPYENPHDVPVVDGASRVTKPTWGRFPSVPSSGGCSGFGAYSALYRAGVRAGCCPWLRP